MEIGLLFGVFVVLLVLGVPIAFALAVSTLSAVLYMGLPPIVVVQQVSAGFNKVSLLAIPLFIFTGELMMRGGISDRLIALASSLVGHIRGGLGQVSVVASTLVWRRFGFGAGGRVRDRPDDDPANGEARLLQGLRGRCDDLGGAGGVAAAAIAQSHSFLRCCRRRRFDRGFVRGGHRAGFVAGAERDGRARRRLPGRDQHVETGRRPARRWRTARARHRRRGSPRCTGYDALFVLFEPRSSWPAVGVQVAPDPAAAGVVGGLGGQARRPPVVALELEHRAELVGEQAHHDESAHGCALTRPTRCGPLRSNRDPRRSPR